MSDTLMRQWQMLRMVPRSPSKIATTELMQKLADKGFETTQRTIQRDLIRLSGIYPLTCDERSKPYGWQWMEDAATMDVPCMDIHTALAFWLAAEHLEALLPKTTLRQLQPHFKTATHVLDSTSTDKGTPAWRNKVRVLTRGPSLKSPAIISDVQHAIYDALLRNRRLTINYNPRWQEGMKLAGRYERVRDQSSGIGLQGRHNLSGLLDVGLSGYPTTDTAPDAGCTGSG